MSAYVSLLNWTDQGAKASQDTVRRFRDAEKVLESMGGHKIGMWWVMGQYDMVLIFEMPDDEKATKFLAGVAKLGNVRSATMRCFSEDEAAMIFS